MAEVHVHSLSDEIFNVQTRVASAGAGGTFHLELDGVDVTGPLTSGDTGGWQTWKTLTKTGIGIHEGQHVLKVAMDSIGTSGNTCNFNWIHFIATTIQSPPFTLVSSATALGPYTTESSANYDYFEKTYSVPMNGQARFFKIRSNTTRKIISSMIVYGNLKIQVQ